MIHKLDGRAKIERAGTAPGALSVFESHENFLQLEADKLAKMKVLKLALYARRGLGTYRARKML